MEPSPEKNEADDEVHPELTRLRLGLTDDEAHPELTRLRLGLTDDEAHPELLGVVLSQGKGT